MPRATLAALPPAPPGRTGWPWTEESRPLPDRTPAGQPWPRLTIVTPSFNQGRFIEETFRSILLQGYPNLEYFVLDGGSTDETRSIIEKYAPWFDFWVSEPDRGQSAAINRGLRMGSGELATWINSDDMLCQHALTVHFSAHAPVPGVIYAGECINIDQVGSELYRHTGSIHSLEDLVRVPSVWQAGRYLCQQEVLFPLGLAIRAGGLNEANHYSMDYELWGELLLSGATVVYTGIPFGFFRWHDGQKTQEYTKQTYSMLDTAEMLLARSTSLEPDAKADILEELRAYRAAYPDMLWKQSGRLAKLGIPISIVKSARHLRAVLEKATQNLPRPKK